MKKTNSIFIRSVKNLSHNEIQIEYTTHISAAQFKRANGERNKMFDLIKSIVAAEFAEDWKIQNQIQRMSYDEFARSRYDVLDQVRIIDSTLPGGAYNELRHVLVILKKYRDVQQGVANVVEAIQQGYLDEDAQENQLTRLVQRMFDKDAPWDPEAQGQSNWSGTSWGAEHNLRATHAIGNWFVEGYIESVKLRVFKNHSNVGIYIANYDGTWPDRYSHTFTVNDKEEFLECLKDYCTRPKETE